MKKNNTVLKASDFKYPSKEERIEALKDYPRIKSFQFDYKSEMESILVQSVPINEAARSGNLFWWSNCLKNRFGKLQETYIYAITCYNRKFSDDLLECSEAQAVDKLLFDYYAEIFYYYFFSARDIIGQILRVYHRLNIKEDDLYFNMSFINKVKAKDLTGGTILETFFVATKKASNFRNGFAHRFSPNEADYRPVYNEDNGLKTLAVNSGLYTSSDEIVENLKDTLESLKELMDGLVNSVK